MAGDENVGRCGMAVDRWLRGAACHDVMGAWHRERDANAMPVYEFTALLATLEPPPPELQELLGAVRESQEHMDGFVGVVSGAVSPAEFFSVENVGRILARAAQPV